MPILPEPGACTAAECECACLFVAGDGISITGTGDLDDPVTISATGGGGGCEFIATDLVAIQFLASAGTLDPCATYVVTDWVSGPGSLPGPNQMYVQALSAHELSPDVLVRTPYGDVGPNRGTYSWTLGYMTYLEDLLNNRVYDIANTGAIDSFPWGTTTWTGNELHGASFPGGFAASASAVAAGAVMTDCIIEDAVLDLTNWGTNGLFTSSRFANASITANADMAILYSTILAGGMNAGSGDSSIRISASTIEGCTLTAPGTNATLSIDSSVLAGMIITANSSAGGTLNIQTVRGINAQISDNTTEAPSVSVSASTVDGSSSVNFTGPGLGRSVERSLITGQSFVTITSGPTSPFDALVNSEVTHQSFLNLNADGSLTNCRVSCGGNLSTGAFAHQSVILDGLFTVTLTAPNTNTLKNAGFDNLI